MTGSDTTPITLPPLWEQLCAHLRRPVVHVVPDGLVQTPPDAVMPPTRVYRRMRLPGLVRIKFNLIAADMLLPRWQAMEPDEATRNAVLAHRDAVRGWLAGTTSIRRVGMTMFDASVMMRDARAGRLPSAESYGVAGRVRPGNDAQYWAWREAFGVANEAMMPRTRIESLFVKLFGNNCLVQDLHDEPFAAAWWGRCMASLAVRTPADAEFDVDVEDVLVSLEHPPPTDRGEYQALGWQTTAVWELACMAAYFTVCDTTIERVTAVLEDLLLPGTPWWLTGLRLEWLVRAVCRSPRPDLWRRLLRHTNPRARELSRRLLIGRLCRERNGPHGAEVRSLLRELADNAAEPEWLRRRCQRKT
ncbi:MAG: hypothetical protein AB7K09_12790 [Planctomycetota bacterium]